MLRRRAGIRTVLHVHVRTVSAGACTVVHRARVHGGRVRREDREPQAPGGNQCARNAGTNHARRIQELRRGCEGEASWWGLKLLFYYS